MNEIKIGILKLTMIPSLVVGAALGGMIRAYLADGFPIFAFFREPIPLAVALLFLSCTALVFVADTERFGVSPRIFQGLWVVAFLMGVIVAPILLSVR